MFECKAFLVSILILKIRLQLQLQKGIILHNKMYKRMWEIAFQMHHDVRAEEKQQRKKVAQEKSNQKTKQAMKIEDVNNFQNLLLIV